MKRQFKRSLTIGAAIILSATPFVCRATLFTLNPFEDAFVATGSASNPGGDLTAGNFGGGGALVIASPVPANANGEFQTVMQFNLSNATSVFNAQFGAGNWAIESVTLQLTASPHGNPIYNPVAPGQFSVSLMQNNSWMEGTGTASIPTSDGISYDTLQSTYINNATDQNLGTFNFAGGSSGATTGSLNLSSSLVADFQGGSDMSLRLYANPLQTDGVTANLTSFLFSSRTDSGVPNRPELIIDVVPEPGSMAIGALGMAAVALMRRKRSRT